MERHTIEVDKEGIESIKDNGDLLLRMKELLITVKTNNKTVAFDITMLEQLCN